DQLHGPLGAYLPQQRWASRSRRIGAVAFEDVAVLREGEAAYLLAFVRVDYVSGEPERFFLPLGAAAAGGPVAIGTVSSPKGEAPLGDAFGSDAFCRTLLRAIAQGRRLPTRQGGEVVFGRLPTAAP